MGSLHNKFTPRRVVIKLFTTPTNGQRLLLYLCISLPLPATLRALEEYATGLQCASGECFCIITAPSPYDNASVLNIVGESNRCAARVGVVAISFFRCSNSSLCSTVHVHSYSLPRSFLSFCQSGVNVGVNLL